MILFLLLKKNMSTLPCFKADLKNISCKISCCIASSEEENEKDSYTSEKKNFDISPSTSEKNISGNEGKKLTGILKSEDEFVVFEKNVTFDKVIEKKI